MLRDIPDVYAGFQKGQGTGDIVADNWIIEKAKKTPQTLFHRL